MSNNQELAVNREAHTQKQDPESGKTTFNAKHMGVRKKMNKTRLLILFMLAMVSVSFSEKLNSGNLTVDRLYLKSREDGVSYNAQAGYFITSSPYYGFDSNHVGERVGYFGRNLARDMELVPKAKHLMTGYTLHRIGFIVGMLAGAGIIAYSISDEIKNGSDKNPDGTYSTKMPTGVKVGFGVIGFSFALELTKPIYLFSAVKEYNKHAQR